MLKKESTLRRTKDGSMGRRTVRTEKRDEMRERGLSKCERALL
jgi:hypothetical protein